MSGKLDQSLDEILSTQRRNAGRRRGPARRASAGNKAPTAPAGGIQKKTQPARSASKPTPKKGSGVTGESKIVVSNLVSHAPKSLHQTSEPTADFRDSPRTFPKARLRYVTTDEAIIAFGLLSTFLSVAFPIDVVSSVGIKMAILATSREPVKMLGYSFPSDMHSHACSHVAEVEQSHVALKDSHHYGCLASAYDMK